MANYFHVYGKELKYSQRLNIKGKIIYTFFGETYPGYINRFFINRRCFIKYKKPGRLRILEIGSANGAFAFWLSRKEEHKVVALDIEKNFIFDCENIREKINRKNLYFVCGDATVRICKEQTFNFVFLTHVLEHIENDQSVLTNIYSALKPGGILLLQVPYGDPKQKPSKQNRGAQHVRKGYTKDHLCKKIVDAGFEILAASGSIGRIGRFAYRHAMKLREVQIFDCNSYILFFPIILSLTYIEQTVALFRNNEPSFKHSPLVTAKRPM